MSDHLSRSELREIVEFADDLVASFMDRRYTDCIQKFGTTTRGRIARDTLHRMSTAIYEHNFKGLRITCGQFNKSLDKEDMIFFTELMLTDHLTLALSDAIRTFLSKIAKEE
jgi:hypothetical protein